MKQPAIYFLTNHTNKVLYAGVTSNLVGRTWKHKKKIIKGFSNTYNLYKLVYFELYENMREAIKREKQIKKWNRRKKENIINKMNPEWRDLYEEIVK